MIGRPLAPGGLGKAIFSLGAVSHAIPVLRSTTRNEEVGFRPLRVTSMYRDSRDSQGFAGKDAGRTWLDEKRRRAAQQVMLAAVALEMYARDAQQVSFHSPSSFSLLLNACLQPVGRLREDLRRMRCADGGGPARHRYRYRYRYRHRIGANLGMQLTLRLSRFQLVARVYF